MSGHEGAAAAAAAADSSHMPTVPAATAAAAAAAGTVVAAAAAAVPVVDGRELPFLVTHWLANYGGGSAAAAISSSSAASKHSHCSIGSIDINADNNSSNNSSSSNNNNRDNAAKAKAAAIQRIHRAASELAAAFADVGAFGTFRMPSLGQSSSSDGIHRSSVSVRLPPQPQHDRSSISSNQNATYADLRRRWSSTCPPDHLPRLLQAVAATNNSTTTTTTSSSSTGPGPANLLNLGCEIRTQHNRNPESGGRTLMEANIIVLDGTGDDDNVQETVAATATATAAPPDASVLQPPVLLAAATTFQEGTNPFQLAITPATTPTTATTTTTTVASSSSSSSIVQSATMSATLMRRFLQLRDNVQQASHQIRTLQKSLTYQEETRSDLVQQRDQLLLKKQQPTVPAAVLPMGGSSNGVMNYSSTNGNHHHHHHNHSSSVQLDDIRDAQLQSERVTHSLQRQLASLQTKYAAETAELMRAETLARQAFQASKHVLTSYRDPPFLVSTSAMGATAGGLAGNRLMLHIHARQVGLSRSCSSSSSSSNYNMSVALLRQPLATGHSGARSTLTDIHKSLLLYHRLSHAATINTHLNYPIYCLRFDRTGRYFVTGADDYLAKVFCLGDYVNGKSVGGGGGAMDNVHNDAQHHAHRGAVLVCTLRGHAGVINDIDVSSDNAFLATASEDGDCRVWGLANGCPIAILRGHVGGANMVKWSTLTPYRLVTAGADGLARTWDIKEACLKRYGKWVGKRAEYKRPFVPIIRVPPPPPAAAAAAAALSEKNAAPEEGRGAAAAFLDAAPPPPIVPLPPPPANVPLVPLPLPPLPPGAVPIGGVQVLPLPPPPAGREDGRFKAGDTIDEGVKLLSKMQHGAAVDERMAISPGTRSRRAPVKVLCVALCPLGGHFVTGADDGICRVFSAADDESVRLADLNQCKNTSIFNGGSCNDVHGARNKSSRRQAPPGKLLLSLKGHLSAVTDLEYSSGGDRILSASQKDGVVHIWSWTDDLLACSSGGSSSSVGGSLLAVTSPATGMTPNCHVSKILIKLTNPNAPAAEMGGGGRQAGVARRRVNRASSASITCDVAHWLHDDSKILTSQSQAAKQNEIQPGSQYFFLWDSITGHCLLGISGGHTMQCPVVIPHPMDVSIFCSAGADGVVKFWDLEAGSCVLSHNNTVDFGPVEPRDVGKISGYLDGSYSPDGSSLVLTDDCGRVTVFDSLSDSSTAKESAAGQRENPLWIKEQYFANDYYDLLYDAHGYCIERGSERPPHLAPRGVRCSFSGAAWPATVELAFIALRGPLPCPENEACWKRLQMRSKPVMSVQGVQRHRGNIVSQFEPQNTVMVGLEAKKPEAIAEENAATNQATGSPRLSSNWRWGDYSDILREEVQDDEEDADDASYDAEATNAARASRANRRIARQIRTSQNDDANDDSDSDSADSDAESLDNRAATGTQPSRASSRGQRQVYVDGQASSDEDDEIVSTHNTPSGPFVADYDLHYFRFPNEATADSIRRHWVQRAESTSSYSGRKCYTPQINDNVVYIPRAHADTIAQFPSLTAPWQSWPERDVWPVVRCRIRSLRYRFPFKAYFGGRNRTGPRCESTVAILTLEVTGIPEELSDERDFVWPKPSFIEQPSSTGHVFQVSMFENEEMDFIIPLGLYQNRLAKLEESLSRNEHAEVEVFYGSNEGPDDGDLVSFKGTVVAQAAVDDDGDPNLCGSGYGSLTIQWEDGSDDHACSPWELVALESTTISDVQRPKLSVEEKKTVRKALSMIRAIEGVKALFDQPVNTRRCSDYESRVEVPMSLSFVRTRLDKDYYANRLSVVADVALISINCWKYNGESELTQVAREMSDKFMDVVLSPDEKTSFLDFQAALVANAPQRAPDANDDDGDGDEPDTTQGTRRSSRRPASSRSALENLPPPTGRSRATTAVRSIRVRISSQSIQRPRRDNNSRSTRTGPSVLESPVAQPPHPGPLNGGNRGRATSSSSGQAPRGRQLRSASAHVPVPNGNSRSQRSVLAPPGGNDDSPSAHTRGASRSAAGHAEAAPPLPRRASAAVSRPNLASSAARGSPRGAAASARQSSRGAAVTRRSMADDSPAEEDNAESEYEEEDHNDDGSSDRHERPSAARNRRGSRPSARRPAAAESSQEEDGDSSADNSDSEASETKQRRPTRASRPGSSRAAAAGIKSGRATRRSSQPSDDEDRSEENGSVEENQRRRSNQLESPGSARRSTRRQQLKQSFVEPGSSEFSDNFDEDDDSDEEGKKPARKRGKASSTKAQKKKAAQRKRPPPDQGKRPAKRRKKNNSDDDDDDDINQRPWPTINIKHITEVGESLLQKLGDLDSDNVFAIPVTEAFPEVGSSYGEVIEQPMDFRTIVEERMPMYQSILELQDDLILVFRNCIQFNYDDPASEFVGLAKLMLSLLEEELLTVCKQKNVPVQWP